MLRKVSRLSLMFALLVYLDAAVSKVPVRSLRELCTNSTSVVIGTVANVEKGHPPFARVGSWFQVELKVDHILVGGENSKRAYFYVDANDAESFVPSKGSAWVFFLRMEGLQFLPDYRHALPIKGGMVELGEVYGESGAEPVENFVSRFIGGSCPPKSGYPREDVEVLDLVLRA